MTRAPRRLAAALTMVLIALSLVTVARAPGAEAVVANRLQNGTFSATTTGLEPDEWTETNVEADLDEQIDAGTVYTPARSVTDGQPGSIWANDPNGGSLVSAAIYPDWDDGTTSPPDPPVVPPVPVLLQEIPTAYLAGEAGNAVTISGYWTRTPGSALGVRVTLKYATTTGSGASEVGAWDITNCTHSDSTNSGWESFSFNCGSTLPSEKIWEARLVIEPTGTFAEGDIIRVDTLSVETEDAQAYPTPSWTTLSSSAFNPVPGTADLIGTSTRYSSNPPSIDGGVFRELYAMTSDGTGATRLTTTGHGYGPNTINPIDHSQVAAVRFTIDWDDNDAYSILTDPARVYVLDLDEDKEIPITPTYWSSGLGGVEWTTDGRYVVFGVNPGRYWEIWQADAENNFALTKITDDTDACFESDVAVANFSHWIAYRKAAMVGGNCYAIDGKGDLILLNLDAPDTSQTTVYDAPTAGLADDGLPFGGYDPGFSADDSELIFSNSVPDDGDLDTDDTYDTSTIPVTGGTPTKLYGFPSIKPHDPTADWTWSLTPTTQWNPSVADTKEGIAFEIEWDGTTEDYVYWGLATFDPYDGSDYTEVESVTPAGAGLGYPHWIIAGHHDPTANSAPLGSGTGFDWPSGAGGGGDKAEKQDGDVAGALAAQNEYHDFSGFNANKSVPSGASIDGIRVRLQGASVNSNADLPYVRVWLSWNDGTDWTVSDDSAAWTTTSSHLFVGGTADTWGRTWSPSEMDNLKVRLQFRCVTTCSLRNWFLDNIDVRVFWQQ